MKVGITAIGVLGPGLEGWDESRAVLRGDTAYHERAFEPPTPEILPSRERRRCGASVRLALGVALEAVERSGRRQDELAVVFGSSGGSGLEVHRILTALSQPEMLVSPTHFHNSVHNAAVGYWCIATSCHMPSTSIAAYDFTFAAALLKASAQVVTEARPVLLVAFDSPFPEPLHAKRALSHPFALAMVMAPASDQAAFGELEVAWRAGAPRGEEAPPSDPGLRTLWSGNPAGRGLPLLEAIVRGRAGPVFLRFPDNGHLELTLTPT